MEPKICGAYLIKYNALTIDTILKIEKSNMQKTNLK